MNDDGLGMASYHLGRFFFHIEAFGKPLGGLLAYQDIAAEFLGEILNSRRQDNGITDKGI